MIVKLHCFLFLMALCGGALAADGDDYFGRKYALVIGNAKYEASPLANPENDAADIAESLRKTGFKVSVHLNLDAAAMRLAIANFEGSLPQNAAVVIFYAGHGVQFQGQNFLIPIGGVAAIKKPEDLLTQAISANELLEQLSGRKGITVAILDACRNSPFTDLPQIASGLSRNLGPKRGLGRVDAKKKKGGGMEGVVIAYSTAPDTTAADGEGRNSPYSKHLAKFLRLPDTSLEAILRRTRIEVTKETGGRQTPWYETSISGDFYPAGRGRIEFDDLLRVLIPAMERNSPPPVSYLYPWEADPEDVDPVKWDGISEPGQFDMLTDAQGKRIETSYMRKGSVVITIDGKPTHAFVGRKPATWDITMLGPRGGVLFVKLNTSLMGFGGPEPNHGFGVSSLLKDEGKCSNQEFALEGTRSYKVNLEGRGPAWLIESWGCGASNCEAGYVLIYNEEDKKYFGCK